LNWTLLYKLNHFASMNGITRKTATGHYQEAKMAYPSQHTNDNVGDYLGFLVDVQLVAETDDMVVITDDGREFLKFLIDQRSRRGVWSVDRRIELAVGGLPSSGGSIADNPLPRTP
jgi:hypothetical protein